MYWYLCLYIINKSKKWFKWLEKIFCKENKNNNNENKINKQKNNYSGL